MSLSPSLINADHARNVRKELAAPFRERLGLKCARCRLEFRVEVHPKGATP